MNTWQDRIKAKMVEVGILIDHPEIPSLLDDIAKEIKEAEERVREEIKELLFSGVGMETGIWHYEMNDSNEMEASYMGEYLSIKEVKQKLTNTKDE